MLIFAKRDERLSDGGKRSIILFMKIKTVIWAVSCVALCSSAQAAFFNFHPATLEEGRALITSDDAHIKRLTKSDLEMRFPGKSADVKYYKKFAAGQVRAFSPRTETQLSNSFTRVGARLEKLGFVNPLTNDIIVVLTTMKEEFNAAGYTRGSTIYLKDDLVEFAQPMRLDFLVTHELFHVLSRHSRDFRSKIYSVIGFTLCDEPAFTPEVRSRLVANPDVERYDCKAVFTIGGKPVEATIVATYDEEVSESLPLTAGVVPIAKPDRVIPVDEVPDFWKVVGRNTQYVIAAEECLAENFTLVVMFSDKEKSYLSRMPNPEIVKKIITILKGKTGAPDSP